MNLFKDMFFAIYWKEISLETFDFIMKSWKVFKNMQIISEKAHCIYR